MNRTIFTVAAAFSASSLLLVDSAVKGTVLLALAAVAALVLRRDSAATRHLVWLLAIVAMLAVPVLSATLPQWRVLPAWASPSPKQAMAIVSPPSIFRPADVAVELPQTAVPVEVERPSTSGDQAVGALPDSHPAPVTPAAAPVPPMWSWNWNYTLPLVWVIGFSVLILRLTAARWMLWNLERRATVVCGRVAPQLAAESRSDSATVTAMEAICSQLGIGRPVTLLIHPDKTIPVVWGILSYRLLLPAAARQWSDEQLRSVLLHELAHIKRCDATAQLLTQIACALHWFNPLVWFAAWRLDVERERACDDLVLASGVRPSAYAGHLLEVVTGLSPSRWTQTCGLAMARQSSLECRLAAVLSKNLNRRSMSVALAGIALAIAVGIAVPIAMLRAADEKWNPPSGAHIDNIEGIDFSAICAHDGKDAAFVIVYFGDLGSSTTSSSNAKTRTWTDSGILTAKKPGIALAFHRALTAPGKISITTAPSEGRDLSKPAQPQREFGQQEYDLAKGRVFLLTDSAIVRQFDLPTPVVTDQATAKTFATLIAAILPNEREDLMMKPNHKDARALYEIWQRHARANGDIPGALIGELATAVKTFIGYNPTWETVPKLNAILPRLDATHDWKPDDAMALLDEVAAVQDSPLKGAADKAMRSTIRNGEALPKKFADVAWGDTQPNGLRAAWVLEPGAAEHHMGATLKARLLVQNPGQVAVMVNVPTLHQGQVKASDSKGADVEVSGISWTTIAQLVPVRLGPGETIEISAPGVGLGPRAGMGPWAGPRVGSNVLAKPGDELTLTHGLVPLDGSDVGVREDDPHVAGPGWWLAHIQTRLNRELPLPNDAAERTRLLDRAVRELFAIAPTAEEIAAFVADQTPGALDALVKRLVERTDVVSFSGKLPTAPVKFHVLAAEATADKQPCVVLGPGEYPLSDATSKRGATTLKIVGRPIGDRRRNDTQILFEAAEFTGRQAPDPHKLEVPDGWGTWAIVCRPGEGFFYLLHKGGVRKIDYSAPRNVTDTPANDLPAEFRDEVKRQLDIHEIPAAEQETLLSMQSPGKDPMAKAPWTASAPGRYVLGDEVHRQIMQTNVNPYREGSRPFLQNKATIIFPAPKPEAARGPKPYEIALPDGFGTYGIVWERGVGVLWVLQKDLVRKYDFTNPWQVQEARFAEGGIINIPEHLREAMKKAFDVPGAPVQKQMPVKPKDGEDAQPKSGAQIKRTTEQKLKWGEPVNGLRMALAWPPVLGEPGMGDTQEFYLVVQNVSKKAVRLTAGDAAPNPRGLTLYDATPVSRTVDDVPIPGDWLLQPREVAFVRLFHAEQKFKDGRTLSGMKEHVVSVLPQYSYMADMNIGKAPAGAWTGTLLTGATRSADDIEARLATKLSYSAEQKLTWGEPVKGLRAALVMRPVPDEPDAEDKNDIFLAVQNVNDAEIWLHASDAAPNPRQLIWRDKGVLETIDESAKPLPEDLRLQAREVAYFRMTQRPGTRNPGGRSTGSMIEESHRKDLTFSLEGSMEIENAPAGAWSGKLLSGRMEGGTAIPAVPEPSPTPPLEKPKSSSAESTAPPSGDPTLPQGKPAAEAPMQVPPDEADNLARP